MQVYSYTEQELTGVVNQGIGCFLSEVETLNIITPQQLNDLMYYQAIIHKRGVFNKFLDKLLFRNKDTEMRFTIVKICESGMKSNIPPTPHIDKQV